MSGARFLFECSVGGDCSCCRKVFAADTGYNVQSLAGATASSSTGTAARTTRAGYPGYRYPV
eukprot:279063-Rhodomonas_salina.5